jgi:apolipoprotein N-acyltransferase
MDRLAHAVILSWGWRRRGMALVAGAASALAMPPFFAFPILFLTFPVFVWLIDGAVGRTRSGRVQRLMPAFSAGWWLGFGYFLAGLWWVGEAFLVEADRFGWLMPFAVLGLAAGLALFWGLGAAIAQLLWSEGWTRIFALAAGLGAAEWLRGNVLTGFPWNAIGTALTSGEALMQSAALFGLQALNILAVLIFAAPAVLVPATHGARRNMLLPGLALAALAGLGLYGVLRLAHAETRFVGETTIRIVQPALEQLQKWDPENEEEVLATYLRLSAPAGAPLTPGTVLVWPESAFPFALTENPTALRAIADLLPPGTALVTGAYRLARLPSGEQQAFNSLYVIADDGTILDAYDKVHLVPFGEYLPFPQLLERMGLRQLARDGFTPGPRRRILNLPSAPPFSPLICYEIIFPGAVLGDEPRPGFLLNVTNDGWFGRSVGPYQHLHQARIRAVEEGLPLVRAANTGISVVTDAFGRLLAEGPLGQATMIEARLPAAVEAPLYARLRDKLYLPLLAVAALIAGAGILYRRRLLN